MPTLVAQSTFVHDFKGRSLQIRWMLLLFEGFVLDGNDRERHQLGSPSLKAVRGICLQGPRIRRSKRAKGAIGHVSFFVASRRGEITHLHQLTTGK